MGVGERRARVGRRHALAPEARASTPAAAAAAVLGLHATDPATVFLAARARLADPDLAGIERALYDDRTLVRILGMRQTMFVVPVDLAPVIHAAVTRPLAVKERRRFAAQLEQAGVTRDGAGWLRKVEQATLEALAARGEATAAELAADVPGLREQLAFGVGKPWEGRLGVSTRVLYILAAEGRVVRGRPRGSWTSTQYRWAPMDAWLPGGLPELAPAPARAELARRWLAAYGPGSPRDLRWWTGWTVAQVREALADLDVVEVDTGTEGGPVLVLAGDRAPTEPPPPWVALLPALDPTVMGWSDRGWYLGDHAPLLFDRSGNAGPTVWCDGAVVGGWGTRDDGEVAFRLLADVGREARAAVEAAAGELGRWLGRTRLKPRFRTPLERDLVS